MSSQLNSGRPPGGARTFFRNLLFLSIYGFSTSLLLGRGSYHFFLYLSAGCIPALLFFRDLRRKFTPPILGGLGLILVLFGQGYLAADGIMATGYHKHLLWAAVPLVGTVLVPGQFLAYRGLNHVAMIALLACTYVALQWLAIWLKINNFGLFPNLHYLAFYSLLTLPILWYFFTNIQGPARWIFFASSLGDLALILKTQSRPAFVALLGSAVVTVPFLSARIRWVTAAAIVSVPAALYLSELYDFNLRVDDLFRNLSREERTVIWKETAAMQIASSSFQWLFGHGIDTYFRDYQSYSSVQGPHYDLTSPHNFVLELLYSHGLLGLSLVMLAYGAWYARATVAIRRAADPLHQRTGMLFLCLMTAHFVHAFLTLPFFSRYAVYPLSLMVGASLVYFRASATHE